MTKKMLIDATHAEETRVVVLDGNRLEEYDVETSTKKQLKGNIYLAKVVRVEPSLQAAFVEYGGNRHGFLAFGEIHPDYYQIPVADRERLVALQEEEARAAEAEDEAADAAESGHAPARLEIPIQQVAASYDFNPTSASEPGVAAAEVAEIVPIVELSNLPAPAAVEASHEGPVERGADTAPESADSDSNPVEVPNAQPWDDQPTEPESDESESTDAESGYSDAAYAESSNAANDFDRIETVANDAPPPETIGGSDEAAEEMRPRRENPRFMRNYKIQEVIRRRQILLVQVVKEERGNKGAALTTYISLAGRYSVLMPNSPRGGGISRKITSSSDRKRLREVAQELEIPKGMGLIIRTAGAARPKPEIKRDGEYLLREWDDIRELTLKSVAPALIYEEASLIKRAIRDVYSRELDEILVDGEPAWRSARDFMRMLMPSHARKVVLWQDPTQSLFARHQVEAQLDAMQSPIVQLRSGGYLVINQTEALVAIDVNSGRATRERDIADTALRTNLEAVDEVARQLRLRDLAGLIVIDLIDMESKKHNAQVERRLKDALKTDRARIQIGHISHFGLMEMSRQRLRPSLAETSTVLCPHCGGTGHVRSTESAALHVLRAVEEEGSKRRSAGIIVHVAGSVALYILNHKRERLTEIEQRCAMRVTFAPDDALLPPNLRIERLRSYAPGEAPPLSGPVEAAKPIAEPEAEDFADEDEDVVLEEAAAKPRQAAPTTPPASAPPAAASAEEGEKRRRRRRRRRRRGGREDQNAIQPGDQGGEIGDEIGEDGDEGDEGDAGGSEFEPDKHFEITESPATIDGFVPPRPVLEPAPAIDLGAAPQPDLPDLPSLVEAAQPRAPRRRPGRRPPVDETAAPAAEQPAAAEAEEAPAEPRKPARRRRAKPATAPETSAPEPQPSEPPSLEPLPAAADSDVVEPVVVEHVPGGSAEVIKPILVDASLAIERKRGWWKK